MLIHTVLFWLRKDLAPAEREVFASEIKHLTRLPYLEHGYGGTPAATEHRPVTDHSFDFAISLHFKSLTDHDFYQTKCPDQAEYNQNHQ